MKNCYKNMLMFVCLSAIILAPMTADAANELFVTNSIGRFEYDTNKDGFPDVILDSVDVNKINQSENANALNIEALQSKYNSMTAALDTADTTLDDFSKAGNALPSDINSGVLAMVKGQIVTGTRTLASETQATAIDANISSGKTAWINGILVTGSGADSKSSYDTGYADGLKKATSPNATVTYTYHVHSAGCYCPGTMQEWIGTDNDSWPGHTIYRHDAKCTVCGRTRFSADGNPNYEWNGQACGTLTCGKSTSTVEGAVIKFN